MSEEAKAWAESRLAKPISDATAKEYERVIARMKRERRRPGTSENGRTRAVERAAYRWWCANEIKRTPERAAKLLEAVRRVDGEAEKAKKAYEDGGTEEKKQRKHSKRASLRGLPSDWRQKLVTAAAGSKYGEAVAVMAACGCRPAELTKGVWVRREGDEVVFVIRGAKVSERTGGGQEWRELRIAADHELVAGLKPGEYKVPTPGAIEDAIEHFGSKLWPGKREKISAYSLRHALASDLKASGLDAEEVAAGLGHASDATMGRYGTASGVGKGGLKVTGAKAQKDVRRSEKSRKSTRSRGPSFSR